MKRKTCVLCVACALGLLAAPSYLAAAVQSNMVVSPPPIPWYEFYEGQFDFRVTGAYASIKSTEADSDLSIKGGGLNLVGRYAFIDQLAMDFMFNYMYAAGSVTDNVDINVHFLNWNPNFEIQPYNTEYINFILLGGYMWTLTPVTVTAGDRTISGTAYMSGIQFGAEVALKSKYVVASPFFLYQNLSGSVEVEGVSSDIPSQGVKTFGVDVVFVPLDLTLSGMMQMVRKNSGYDVFYFSLSYDFRFGGKEDSETSSAMRKPQSYAMNR